MNRRATSLLLFCAVLFPAAVRAQEKPAGSGAAPDTLRAVEVSVVDQKPVVDSVEAARRAAAYYPPSARAAGVSGTAIVRFVVDTLGNPLVPRVLTSSGNGELDAAALRVVGEMRFASARWVGKAYPVWTDLPVSFGSPARAARNDSAGFISNEDLAPPSLLNLVDVARSLSLNYPPLMRDAAITGQVLLVLRVDERGIVDQVRVTRATRPEFVVPAVSVVPRMRFSSARHGDRPMQAWVSIPLTFHP